MTENKIDIDYSITFFSNWNCGSGLTAGSDKGDLVIKTKDNLPFIPGKTLKGLLKEAANEIALLDGIESKDFIEKVFGEDKDGNDSDPKKGECHFGNADIDEATYQQLVNLAADLYPDKSSTEKHPANRLAKLASHLYQDITSTALNKNGLAEEHSLRRIETTVPITLHAKIRFIDQCYKADMDKCLKWVKRMGQNRTRGMGRCKFEIVGKEANQ